jgi:hypothetical protein
MLSRITQRFPFLTATGIYTAAVAFAFLPFFQGQFLVNAMSDARTGFPGRDLAADYFHRTGSILEWMPYTFGGMPFLPTPPTATPSTRPSCSGSLCRPTRG